MLEHSQLGVGEEKLCFAGERHVESRAEFADPEENLMLWHKLKLDAVDQLEHVSLSAVEVPEALDVSEVCAKLLVLFFTSIRRSFVEGLDDRPHLARYIRQPLLEAPLVEL